MITRDESDRPAGGRHQWIRDLVSQSPNGRMALTMIAVGTALIAAAIIVALVAF